MLTFLAVIMLGTMLLMLPFSTASGEWCPLLTALFTAATSVCVTGLVVVETAAYWSFFGKLVILLLIQIGGLSIVTLWARMMMLLRRRFSLRFHMLLRDYYNMDSMQGIFRFMKRALKGTLIAEGAGAALYGFVLIPRHGFLKGLWLSVFTSVSAFCNAGIDIFGPDSMVPFRSDLSMNLITMLLIVLGGLGFFVWFDAAEAFRECLKKKIGIRGFFSRLHEHTKLVLTVTLILILSGTFLVYVGECRNPASVGGMRFGEGILASLFQSVTFRTAGFSTLPQQDLTPFTCFAGLFYMMIGGSPAGTAGGIKTVTAAILIVSAVSYVRQKNETVVFGNGLVPADRKGDRHHARQHLHDRSLHRAPASDERRAVPLRRLRSLQRDGNGRPVKSPDAVVKPGRAADHHTCHVQRKDRTDLNADVFHHGNRKRRCAPLSGRKVPDGMTEPGGAAAGRSAGRKE